MRMKQKINTRAKLLFNFEENEAKNRNEADAETNSHKRP